jgi:DNA-binding transcriptional LysR family regulator
MMSKARHLCQLVAAGLGLVMLGGCVVYEHPRPAVVVDGPPPPGVVVVAPAPAIVVGGGYYRGYYHDGWHRHWR